MGAEFYKKLLHKVVSSLPNDYDDNFDEGRYGEEPAPASFTGKIYSSRFITRRFVNKSGQDALLNNARQFLEDPLFEKFEQLCDSLANAESKDLLIALVAYRLLGYKKVKLPLNNPDYWEGLKKIDALETNPPGNVLSVPGMRFYDLKPIGFDIKLTFSKLGILTDFVTEQYRYKSADKTIMVTPGDVVIDGGGFYGDTALYFAAKAGPHGKVFTFEFIAGNLKVLKENIAQNPHLATNIEVIEHPLWEKDNETFYYVDKGPASTVSTTPTGNGDKAVQSKTIDGLVREKGLQKVDFIKLDIEGAEPYALTGAVETIKKFKPKLAIAIYHSVSDFVNIPAYILSLCPEYKLYLGHYTIYDEETLIYATTD